jgi:hypothetical protein
VDGIADVDAGLMLKAAKLFAAGAAVNCHAAVDPSQPVEFHADELPAPVPKVL